jgi:hypothetical protein
VRGWLSKPSTTEPGTAARRELLALRALLLVGLLVRLAAVLLAEKQLDADESTVGVMALDVLEKHARPLFFYGGHYNGGGAIEAYIGALVFAIAGPSVAALKLSCLLLWAIAGWLFTGLCARALPPRRALLAVGLFALGTPFFLEWSAKARGGFVETLLFSVILLRMALPPAGARAAPRPARDGFWFGVVSAVGTWASEMLLPMIACAGAYTLWRHRGRRGRFVLGLAAGAAIGLLPLVSYNLTHQARQLAESVAGRIWLRGTIAPLSLANLELSAQFVLGGAWPLALGCVMLGAIAAWVRSRRWPLEQIASAYLALYVTAYWLNGLRILEAPPSRALYPLHLAVPILMAAALDTSATRLRLWRWTQRLALAAWVVAVAISVGAWLHRGEPREAGSWRSTWSLVDGRGLLRALREEKIDTVFVTYWTAWPIRFAERIDLRTNPGAPRVECRWVMPDAPLPRHRKVGIALRRGTRLLWWLQRTLAIRGVTYRLRDWGDFRILSGFEPTSVRRGRNGYPMGMVIGAQLPYPERPDGFN